MSAPVSEDDECSICLNQYRLPCRLRCNHIFCYTCIARLVDPVCPLDRSPISLPGDITMCQFPSSIKLEFRFLSSTRVRAIFTSRETKVRDLKLYLALTVGISRDRHTLLHAAQQWRLSCNQVNMKYDQPVSTYLAPGTQAAIIYCTLRLGPVGNPCDYCSTGGRDVDTEKACHHIEQSDL